MINNPKLIEEVKEKIKLLSKEELKAILQFKQIDLEDCSCEKCLYQEIESCRGCPTMIKETLLNLIEKQQKEIENSVSKDKIRELRDIDNIDLIQYKLKKLLEEII